ncbi:MAG: TonB-dependent receptor plug domain-containing protein, partial [Gemmatimonadota bacterium]
MALSAVSLVIAVPAAAQEDVDADSAAVPDTVRPPRAEPDTMVGELPAELVGALADSAAVDSSFAVLAQPLEPEPDQAAGDVRVWDRERIRRSNATHLGELLSEMVPGTLPLRAGFFTGPHHLLDGPLGPTSVEVRVDGRPLAPLIGAQPDLSRILLAMIDEVRVIRGAAGLGVDLTTVRRTDPRAYSRIEAGSGDPALESLRLVFTNGFGTDFTTTAGFE